MKSSTFYGNEYKNLYLVVVFTSTILMFFVASDAVRSIDFNFISTFDFSEPSLRSAILSTFLVLTILFWILSILNKKIGDATKFIFFLSLSIAGLYISNPSTSLVAGESMIEPLILVFLSLIFIESISRLYQSEKRFKAEKKVSDKAMAMKSDSIFNLYISKMENIETLIISKIYYGSKSLKIFKTWLTPSFILLTFIGILQIILTAPDYITKNFDLSGISQDRLKYYLASFLIMFLLVGIWIINSILRKVYSSIAVGETEKRIEVENLYNKCIIVEKKKNKKHIFDWTSQNKVFAQAKYIAIIGIILAIGSSNMDGNQIYGTTLQFFNPSIGYEEHTFLNELNENVIEMEKNIYDIDEIIMELNESIWSYVNV